MIFELFKNHIDHIDHIEPELVHIQEVLWHWGSSSVTCSCVSFWLSRPKSSSASPVAHRFIDAYSIVGYHSISIHIIASSWNHSWSKPVIASYTVASLMQYPISPIPADSLSVQVIGQVVHDLIGIKENGSLPEEHMIEWLGMRFNMIQHDSTHFVSWLWHFAGTKQTYYDLLTH